MTKVVNKQLEALSGGSLVCNEVITFCLETKPQKLVAWLIWGKPHSVFPTLISQHKDLGLCRVFFFIRTIKYNAHRHQKNFTRLSWYVRFRKFKGFSCCYIKRFSKELGHKYLYSVLVLRPRNTSTFVTT